MPTHMHSGEKKEVVTQRLSGMCAAAFKVSYAQYPTPAYARQRICFHRFFIAVLTLESVDRPF